MIINPENFYPEENSPSPEEEKERVTKEALEDGKFTYYLVRAAEEVRKRWQEEELTPEEEDEVLKQVKENYLERMKEQGLLKEDQEEAFGGKLKETALNETGGSIVVNSEEKEGGGDVIGDREGFLNRERYFRTIEGIKENPEDDTKEWKKKLEESLYGKTQTELGLDKHIEGFGRAALEEEDLKTAAKSLSRREGDQKDDFSEKLQEKINEARASENEEVRKEAEEAAEIFEEAQIKEN